jgi:two-component system response regulator (stage 0 sporulation protein F)
MKIPNMDGLEILKRINQEVHETKVIIMTAYGELDMIEQAMEHGAVTHFSKPFDIEEVLTVIKRELS